MESRHKISLDQLEQLLQCCITNSRMKPVFKVSIVATLTVFGSQEKELQEAFEKSPV